MGYNHIHQIMSRETILCILGFLLILVPFLGVPSTYRQYLLAFLGLVVFMLAYQLRRKAYVRSLEETGGERKAEMFAEHEPQEKQRV